MSEASQLRFIFLLFSTILLTACLPKDQPSDEQIIQLTKQHFDQQQPSLMVAQNVIKQNGYKQNDTHYVAEIKIIAKATQSLESYASAIAQDPSISPLEKIGMTMQIGIMKMTMDNFKAGDFIEFNKEYLFIKTDNGWLLKKELTEEHN